MHKSNKTYIAILLLAVAFVILSVVLFEISRATYRLEQKKINTTSLAIAGKTFYSIPMNHEGIKTLGDSLLRENSKISHKNLKQKFEETLQKFEPIEHALRKNLSKEGIEIDVSTGFYINTFTLFDSILNEHKIISKENSILLFGKSIKDTEHSTRLDFYQKGKTYFLDIGFKIEYPSLNRYVLNKSKNTILISGVLLGAVFFIILFTIITLIKQKRLSKIKSDFIDHITHELNTPLSTIQLAISSLQKKEEIIENKENYHLIHIIDKQSRKLNKMLANVIDLNIIKKNNLSVSPVNIEIKAVNSILETLKLKYPNKSIDMELISNNICHIYFDAFYFVVVMENLIENAIKFSGEKPKIKIIFEDCPSHDKISIVDNGIGISKKNLRKVFYRNFQVKTNGDKGLGFGLYYVKEILKAHKGRIAIESQLGVGTTIHLEIPKAYEPKI